jgi:hypothetical protein
MKCRIRAGGVGLVYLALVSLSCRADDGATEPCPGASAWERAHPEESEQAMAQRDAARVFTEPALRKELAERVDKDQRLRIAWLAAPRERDAARRVGAVDDDNLAWLRALVRDEGFPSVQQVGEVGVHQAWLLLQHADRSPSFQAQLLPTLEKRHADGELGASDLARFTDRVLVAQRRPQRYGTQFSPAQWISNGFRLPDGQDVQDVDARRDKLGLMPLADYICMMINARKGSLTWRSR